MSRQRDAGSALRGFFLKVTKDADAEWSPQRDSAKFLGALLAFDDPQDLLYRLTNPNEQGARRLKAALSHDASGMCMSKYVVPFLRVLGGDALSGGICRAPLLELLELVYRVPGLLGCMRQAISEGAVLDASPLEEVRRNPDVQRVAEALAAQGGAAAQAAARLQVVLAGTAAARGRGGAASGAATAGGRRLGGPALEDIVAGPGGRHDNDSVDYRSIKIAPTSAEALCARPPYLPRLLGADGGAGETHPLQLPDHLTNPEAGLLDRQFRLLREDFAQPLRQVLAALGFTQGLTAGSQQPGVGGSSVAVHMASPAEQPQQRKQTQQQAKQQQRQQQQQTPLASNAAAQRNVFPLVAVTGVAAKPRPCVLVSVQLPMSHRAARLKTKKEREEFWSDSGKGTLPSDALVCIARRPAPDQPQTTPLVFGTIVRRDSKEMAMEQPVVGIAFERGQLGAERLLAELGRGPSLQGQGLVLVQVSTSFFSIRPVLACLQAMTGVPLADELLHGRPPGHIEYLEHGALGEELSQLAAGGLRLDPSQRTALEQSMTQRVALIQGPPGTGKTFVGALLCDALVRRSDETILVVCYTNHALDQFLEALLAKGIKDVVRVGGRSKNPALAQYNLRELAGPGNPNRQRMSQTEFRRMTVLRDEEAYVDEKMTRLQQLLVQTGAPPEQQKQQLHAPSQQQAAQQSAQQAAQHGQGPSRATNLNSQEQQPQQQQQQPFNLWLALEWYLQEEQDVAWEQLEDSSSSSQSQGQRWRAWLSGLAAASSSAYDDHSSADGWKSANASRTAPGLMPYQKAEWTLLGGGGSGGGEEGRQTADIADVDSSDVWCLSQQQRMQLAAQWLREARERWAEDLAGALVRRNELQTEVRSLHDSSSRAVLRAARVIGCTSTGAAMYKELLRDADVDPGVVLVEEAGELLEAHVLTCLSRRTKQLIMIGDHKQLRPKVECWSLAVQSGAGHDLNVSLFERLVLSGFPHATLAVQHRMHPDISALVRPTYPALVDAERVRQHPPVLGLPAGRRVVFVDHRVPEQGEEQQGSFGAHAAHVSKVNLHEVALVRETVRYLLRQGYAPGQLVVLTPYLGQLLEVQRELSKDTQVLLDELDLRDLRSKATPEALKGVDMVTGPSRQAGAGGAARSREGDHGVRVATIDNYQGEEADVVVASLVRSNAAGSVGFLREPERINVLLSRARHGMLLIGNAATLRSAKSQEARRHWGRVLDALESAGALQPGLPVACQRHGTPALLSSPEAFAELAPDGGCRRPCHAKLPCGHVCMLRCHPFNREHQRVVCKEEVLALCDRGHIIKHTCSHGKADVVCQTCVDVRRIEEQERKEAAKLEEEADRKRRQADVERARLQAQIQRLHQQQASLEEERGSQQAAVRLELDQQRLAKQVELQKKFGAKEMEVWEREQRQLAQQQLAGLEVDAALEAEVQAEDAALRAAQRAEETQRQQLAAAEKQLGDQDAAKNRDLQRILNAKQRLMAQSDEQRGLAEARAGTAVHRYRTVRLGTERLVVLADRGGGEAAGLADRMSAWKEALTRMAKDDRGAGLEAFGQQLRAAAGTAETAADTANILDAVFCQQGIGASLLKYAAAAAGPPQGAPKTSASADPNAAKLKRGLALIQDAKWIDALKYFNALAEQQPSSTVAPGVGSGSAASGRGSRATAGRGSAPPDPGVAAMVSLCRAKLGLEPPAVPPAAGLAGRGKKPPAVAPAALPLVPQHPAEHLAAAMQPRRAADPLAQRTADARAAGQALAYLLHPETAQLPSALRDEALRLLRELAPSLSGPMVPAAAAAGGSASGAGGGGQPAGWVERARRSASLSKLLQLTGLAPVKQAMFDLAAAVELDKERGRPLGAKQYNVRFYGNPGTGKTTVARLYAGLLKELGVLPAAEVVETSGSDLLTGGVSKLKEELKKLEKGGVLFLDEAYQLNPKTNPMGAQVLDFLLPEMENRRGKLVMVLAGYKKQMEELMAHNEGLPSRFVQEFTFPDYSDDELFVIWRDLIASDTNPRFRIADERHLRIAARRLGRQRGTVGFGNARAVRNAYEQAQRRQSSRVLAERRAGGSPDALLLVREDLLGPRQLDVSSSSALQQLGAMRGLRAVKQQVDDLLALIRTNGELEEQEQPLQAVNLNRVFLGNPGTGKRAMLPCCARYARKTTVAGIYGRILRDLGLLSKGDVEVRVPSDFVGSVLGESEKRTEAILEATRGCVLVIDEAYGLHSEGGRDPFREAVVDTLVARVQGVPGDDRCVLLLGYEEQMEAMMRKANPGLARRFQLREAWRFEDYGPEDLLAITREAARKRGWALEEAALLAAVEALDQEARKPNFGNAGAVNNLLSVAALRMQARLRDLPPEQRARAAPTADDFLPPRERSDPAGIFDDLIGCREVLDKLRDWQATIRACQAMGRDPLQSFELNFRFVGAPGTGKTTVARRVGKLFESLGLLADGQQMVSCSASDFVTGYVNQSSGKTRELFAKAVGGVLFIDEAYRLNPNVGGLFMQEVLDEIVQLLTEPAYQNKMVVILAGYDKQIEELMTVNPGLKSRFSQRLHFPDFTPADAASLLRLQLRKEYGLELERTADAALEGLAGELAAAPNWSNGRDVGTWVKRAFTAYSRRNFEAQPAPSGGSSGGPAADTSLLWLADLRSALDSMLDDRKAPPRGPSYPQSDAAARVPQQSAQDFAVQRAAPPPRPAVRTEVAAAPPAAAVATEVVEEQDIEQAAEDEPGGGAARGDFGGLSAAFLQAMQDALESLGYDLSSMDAVQAMSGDPGLVNQLLPFLSVPGVTDANVLREMVRQWQAMLAKRMEEERELARKKQRPVWRCAACGRYGCPVAPYIERYEEA
ncbi:NFX1-type zinc finger-containing protein 1 [Tetrabaena socialis]|uniref:NFX1-type zinc finger-containing protein 1 n=1 Tax=Tetrabaena socialis TaxID=47790 RepID=A0A2J8A739_9CHLO|nr:NFX1-type zinc finger-containing protein 1 [Tetrabaena socialis]|eukprot:PNH08303.1 NFX1-type zinc finger-containing protein 1 [Tetrabaena socialis]